MTTFNASQIIRDSIEEAGYSSVAPASVVGSVVTNIEDALHEVALGLIEKAADAPGYDADTVRSAFEDAGLLQPEPFVADEEAEVTSVEDRLDRIERAVADLSALAERHLGSRV